MNYEQFDIQFVQIYILCITANAHSYIRVNEFCFRRKEISKNSPRPFIQKSLLLLILYENMDIPFLGRLFRGIPLAKNERVSHTFGNYWKLLVNVGQNRENRVFGMFTCSLIFEVELCFHGEKFLKRPQKSEFARAGDDVFRSQQMDPP